MSAESSLLLTMYRVLTTSCGVIIYGYLAWRLWHGKEELTRLGERLGQPGQLRPPGPLLWLHAASVGESLSVLPLIDKILRRQSFFSVLMTTGSVSSALLVTERLPTRAYHQYMPMDRAVFLRRFLDYWRPTLVLWTESEFWPNAILEIRRRAVPLVLVNGRISEHSFRRWQKWPQGIGPMLAAFDLCLGQTLQDCDRLSVLGATRTDYVGNLKFAAPPLPADTEALARMQRQLAGRPVWLAASTHAGEESAAGRIHQKLITYHPRLLTIVAPRHPSRGTAIAAELAATGLQVTRRSVGESVPSVSGVYLVDTIGELGLFFRVAPVVFMGKSLFGSGGQNPLEPARLGCAILFGPHMDNFADIAARMVAAGTARTVSDEVHLGAEVETLLADRRTRATMGVAGKTFANTEAGVIQRLIERLTPYLDLGAIRPESGRAKNP
ncbi:Lipid IVA 3-deoxy-D-manno-octulosonic acid transferase [often with also] [invertebrate metagenome]|uniref:Lipid IVA 3-deoxy-D-manno-octulosonic acid transferase [often with also] n=1 Tax=invertebrate metagenome TaxID=1711999 RepID=A0A484H7S7_9ZZZZ